MLLGILSDAHGNVRGLKYCLGFLKQQGVKRFLFLGDAVGYFPNNAATCRYLLKAHALCLMGNHEAMLLGLLPLRAEKEEIIHLERHAKQLPNQWLRQIRKYGPTHLLNIAHRKILLVHGTPEAPFEGRIDIAKATMLSKTSPHIDAILSGHTHRALHIKTTEGALVLNPGSCGYPRDNGTMLSCATLDTKTMKAKIFRLPFKWRPGDFERTHGSVLETTYRRFEFEGIPIQYNRKFE